MESGRFRYIGSGGVEHTVGSVLELSDAIVAGHVLPETMLFDSRRGTWCPAAETDVFQLAVELAQSQSQRSARLLDPEASPTGHPQSDATRQLAESRPASAGGIRTRLWPFAVAVTGLLIVLTFYWEFLATEDVAASLGYTIGTSLFAGLFIFGARRLFRTVQPDLAHTLVAVFFLMLAWRNHRDFTDMRTDTKEALGTLAAYASDSAVPGTPVDPTTLNGIITGSLQRNGAAWERYNQVVEKAGEAWLDPVQLASPTGREQARVNSVALRAGADDLGASMRASMELGLTQLRPLAQRGSGYRSALKAAEASSIRTEQLLGDFLAAEHALLDRFDEIIAFVSASRPELDPTGQHLLFDTNREAQRYNALIAGLEALVSAEDRAVQALQEREQDFRRKIDSAGMLLGQDRRPRGQ